MVYATAQQAMHEGAIVYGIGNVTAVRRENGFIYWPKQQSVAFDSVSDDVVTAKIEHVKNKLARQRSDDAAIRVLLPTLLAVAADGMEEEQRDVFGGKPDAEDSNTDEFATAYAESVQAERARWNNVAARNRTVRQAVARTGKYASANNKAAKAADSVALNSRKAKGYSVFTSSSQLCKATS